MANAMVALATTTLSSAASTVTFGSIPATYRDLQLIINAEGVSGTNDGYVFFNADTAGANYSEVQLRGNGTTIGTNAYSAPYINGASTWSSGNRFEVIISILDYAQTDKHKSSLIKVFASQESNTIAMRWANTTAITSVQLTTAAGFISGSTFALYGVKA